MKSGEREPRSPIADAGFGASRAAPPIAPIVVEGLRYYYPPPRPGVEPVAALRGIDLSIARGECLALVGPVGAGKSTLCQALVGLVPHAWGGDFGGRVVVEGLDTRERQPADICRHVGIVFQDAESQLFCSTVEDETAFAPEGLGLPRDEIERRVDWALNAVGLADCRGRSPRQLSGGQQQRLALAAALASRPRILVLDEPAASLDPRGAREIFAVLAELRRADGLTLVIAEQDVERVAEFADRVAILDSGRIVALDSPRRAFAVGASQLPVDPPPISALAARLRGAEPDLPSFTTTDEAERALSERLPMLDSSFPRVGECAESDLPPPTPLPHGGRGETMSVSMSVPLSASLGDVRPIVELRDLWHVYEGGRAALAGVDLAVERGSRLALVGQNGSGKTTLAKHLVGLLRPTRGAVFIDGVDAARRSIGELASTVGYVFQNPDHQIFAPSVWEELAWGPRQLGVSEAEIGARVDEALDLLGLTAHRDDPPAALGYGLRRLVGLAGVLTSRPRVLVLDEPFAGLDWRAGARILDRLSELNRAGCTVLLITHDMRIVAEFATRVVALAGGRVAADTTPRELFARPDLPAEAGLVRPRIAELARRLRPRGLRGDSLTVDELAADYLSRRGRAAAPDAGGDYPIPTTTRERTENGQDAAENVGGGGDGDLR